MLVEELIAALQEKNPKATVGFDDITGGDYEASQAYFFLDIRTYDEGQEEVVIMMAKSPSDFFVPDDPDDPEFVQDYNQQVMDEVIAPQEPPTQ